MRDKKNSKYLTNCNFKSVDELKKYVSKFYKSKFSFLKNSYKNKNHIGNLRIHNINKKKSSAFLGIIVGNKKQKNKGTAQEVIHHICKFLFFKI